MPPYENSISLMQAPTNPDHGAVHGLDPIVSFREKINKPHLAFNTTQKYRELSEDRQGDVDDPQSFTSTRLARDQDKPKRKNFGSQKNKIHAQAHQTTASSPFVSPSISSPARSLSMPNINVHHGIPMPPTKATYQAFTGPVPIISPSKSDAYTFSRAKSHALSYFSMGTENIEETKEKEADWSPKSKDQSTDPKENRHPQILMGLNLLCSAGARPVLRSLNFPVCSRGSTVEETTEMVPTIPEEEPEESPYNGLSVALQVVRLKKELRKKKGASQLKKSVRFCEPLVTAVAERPYTNKQDMETLYFVQGELEELEFDRSTVDNDQFECILEEEDQEAFIEVEHTSRKLHVIRPGELPHSMSDLSFY